MRENYRNSIASIKKFPQFTTMNVIDGQAGLIICASLIFYSLTIDNILNIIVILTLAGITISSLTGDNGVITNAKKAKSATAYSEAEEDAKLESNNLTLYGLSNSYNTKKLALEACRDLGVVNDTKKGWATVKYSENTIYVKNVNSSIKKDYNGLQNGETVFKLEINKDTVDYKGEIESNSDEYKNATSVLAINENLKVGDSVQYESKAHKNEVTISKDYYGDNESSEKLINGNTNEFYHKDQVLKYSDLKNTSWKVWNINKEDGVVELISKEPIWKQQIELIGSNGFNNGPKILNDICSDFYSDSKRNITARSLDLKDIEDCYNISIEEIAKKINPKYGTEITTAGIPMDSEFLNYLPIIYGSEENISITEKQKNDSRITNMEYISSNNGENTISTALNRKSITLTDTSYLLPQSDYSKYINETEKIEMIGQPSWLASRYIQVRDDNYVNYCLYGLSNNGFCNYGMTGTTHYSNGYVNFIRPIVTIDSSVIKIKKGLFSWKIEEN